MTVCCWGTSDCPLMPTLNTQGMQKVSLLHYLRQPLFRKVQNFFEFFSGQKKPATFGGRKLVDRSGLQGNSHCFANTKHTRSKQATKRDCYYLRQVVQRLVPGFFHPYKNLTNLLTAPAYSCLVRFCLMSFCLVGFIPVVANTRFDQ
ncbi:hypothetical protein V5J35_002441 [Endozoicomonas sp. NE40]|uniref:Uncharacterized protein n=1 Tax=Endozoicomonas lisbonensis TaxID=3120522 RepID=A0ABV2SIP5_9GAMM